jgi:hypothetical protein
MPIMLPCHGFRGGRAGLAIGLVLSALLVGCSATPTAPRYPELTYGHYGVIGLDVASIQFISTFVPPRKAPHVEHLSPANPVVAMERWTNDRLRAVGREGIARVVVSNASLVETPLKTTGGVRGWFTTDQAARYDAAIEVSVQIRDAGGVQRAYAQARADRSRTVAEDATITEREKVLFDLVEATTTEINSELDTAIRQFLRRYIVQP